MIARWLVLAVRGLSLGNSLFSLRGLMGLGILAVVSFLLVMSYAGLGAILQSGRERRERPQMEDRYRSMIEETSDIIQIVSPDGKFLYVNRAWHNTFGYSEDDLPNLTLMDLLHPDERQKAQPQIGVLMNEGGVIEIETRFVTKNGKTIWVEGNSTCELARAEALSGRGIFRSVTQRKVLSRRSIFHNVTERKQAEAERARLLAILEEAPDFVATTTPDGKVMWINRAWRRSAQPGRKVRREPDEDHRSLPGMGEPNPRRGHSHGDQFRHMEGRGGAARSQWTRGSGVPNHRGAPR